MDASCYLTCLWPGLSELWYRGKWSSLPAAVAFAAVLNFLLVARFIYPEWLAPSLVRLACWVAVAAWLVLALRAVGRLPTILQPRAVAEAPDRYAEARDQYLRGQWTEAEAVLADCLEIDPRDCQSLLLLSAVYRHTERFEAAENVLQQLARLETADHWWLECQTERQRLERDRSAGHAEPDEEEADGSSETDSPGETDGSGEASRETDSPDAAGLAASAQSHGRQPPQVSTPERGTA